MRLAEGRRPSDAGGVTRWDEDAGFGALGAEYALPRSRRDSGTGGPPHRRHPTPASGRISIAGARTSNRSRLLLGQKRLRAARPAPEYLGHLRGHHHRADFPPVNEVQVGFSRWDVRSGHPDQALYCWGTTPGRCVHASSGRDRISPPGKATRHRDQRGSRCDYRPPRQATFSRATGRNLPSPDSLPRHRIRSRDPGLFESLLCLRLERRAVPTMDPRRRRDLRPVDGTGEGRETFGRAGIHGPAIAVGRRAGASSRAPAVSSGGEPMRPALSARIPLRPRAPSTRWR